MATTQAINPHNGQVLGEYTYISDQELTKKIEKSYEAFQVYRKTDIKTRSEKLAKLSAVLNENVQKYADVITKEQGKPITEAINEVKKAAGHAKFYADHLEEFLKDEVYKTEFKKSVVELHPIGPIFQVAPFNFPFWLVFKSVIPTIAIGNTVITKTASACPETGLMVQDAFDLAGFNNGEFQYVLTTQEQSELLISHPYIKGVSFTGSTKGGSSIASLAGKYIKKTIMELGGSDPFIVLEDADVNLAVDVAIQSRLRNAGQVCTCAKRFIIHENVYEEFKNKLVEKVGALKVGNPIRKDVNIGPLTKPKVREDIEKQIAESIKQGGKILVGGKRPDTEETKDGYYYLPTIVEVQEGNILFREETFGPVLPLLKVKNYEDIARIANDTEYGLGGAIISQDLEKAQQLGKQLDVGALFFNGPVSADSRLPSGGVKNSGFGRECGPYGLREFANIKTVVAK